MSRTGTGALQWFDVTATVDIAGAYASGDLLFDPLELEDFFTPLQQTSLVQSLHVLDEGDQAAALDLLFVTADTSWGTINNAASPTDVIARTITGALSVAASDYIDLANSQLAIPQFNPFLVAQQTTSVKSMWVVGISRGSPTYVAATDLKLRIGVLR